MNKQINLACHVPNPFDATSIFRGYGPIGHLQRNYPVNAYALSDATMAACQVSDVCFFQRPASTKEVDAMGMFKRMNVPVIVDYDDYLLGVPTDNQSSPLYNRPDTLSAVKRSLDMADLVFVSTKELKRQFEKFIDSAKILIVKNALDERQFHTSSPGMMKSIAWRGGMTHERELRDFSEAIKSTNIQTRFFGFDPYFLTQKEEGESHKRQFAGAYANPLDFYDALQRESSQIGIVPLRDSTFNRCKSNIAALEMIWAGAIPLVPAWEEWKIEGVISYNNANDFKNQLNELCNMPKNWYPEQHKKAWTYVKDQFTLQTVNYARYEAIENLVKKK